MRINPAIRLAAVCIVLMQVSCAEFREYHDYERKRKTYEAAGVTLPYKAPLPPVPVF